jgi:hypothetical protein
MPNGVRVEQFRTLPVTPELAFRGIIEMNVPAMFHRRYGPIPPILAVSGRDADDWRGTVGQTRVLELGPWGSIRETVVSVDDPRAWRYRISDFKGPLAALLAAIEAEFLFDPAGTGTRITWRYNMIPRSRLVAAALPAFGWFWRGYARQMLEELSKWLVG